MQAEPQGSTSAGRREWSTWPRYESAVLGFPNYWYPVMWSSQVKKKPIGLTLLGQPIIVLRSEGKVYALHDRCLHRGVPLRLGEQHFPNTWSCCYHGWTYSLETGTLVAVITDGPDSPICGKVRLRIYPVEERLGLVWIYMGEGAPPPLEDDIPEELLKGPMTICGRISVRRGNWRLAAENGFDQGHAKYLHRNTPFVFFRRMPVWDRSHVVPIEDGKWIARVTDEVHFQTEFPGLGKFPKRKQWWKRSGGAPRGGSPLRLPGMLRIAYPAWSHYEWYIPVDADHHRYLQMAVKFQRGFAGFLFTLKYWTNLRWIFHGLFNDQDALMVDSMDSPPERLYRPDVSIIAWRKMCEFPRGVDGTLGEVTEADVADLEVKEPVQ
jgi:phenylpropionate dioxygenase-like ring-hydroxylating dioxygenase large terminal subunit